MYILHASNSKNGQSKHEMSQVAQKKSHVVSKIEPFGIKNRAMWYQK
jgi:hypothetical protein